MGVVMASDAKSETETGTRDEGRAGRAETFRRAGLTETESQRLARIEEYANDRQAFWEASPIGMLFWLVWKILYKGFQPALLLLAIAASVWFSARILDQLGGLTVIASAPVDLAERIETAFEASRAPDEDAYQAWVDELADAINGDIRRRPDLDRFAGWAEAATYWLGEEDLALRLLAAGRDPARLDAELRALPPQERERRLSGVIEAQLQQARLRGLEPEAIIFAPANILDRYERSRLVWEISAAPIDDFFRASQQGQLELSTLSGLVTHYRSDTRIYSGVRHLVIQLCLAPQAQDRFAEPCAASIIPRGQFDPFLLSLSALEAGMVDLGRETGAARAGASILRAGYVAGRMPLSLEQELRSLFETHLPQEALVDALADAQFRPDLAFAAPRREQDRIARAYTGSGEALDALGTALSALADIRLDHTARVTTRMVSGLYQIEDIHRLSVLLDAVGPAVLAMQERLGEDMYGVLDVVEQRGEASQEDLRGLALSLLAGLLVLLITMVRLSTEPLIRSAGRVRWVDVYLSRLFLGKKS